MYGGYLVYLFLPFKKLLAGEKPKNKAVMSPPGCLLTASQMDGLWSICLLFQAAGLCFLPDLLDWLFDVHCTEPI